MRITVFIIFIFLFIPKEGYTQEEKIKPTIEVGPILTYNANRNYYSFEQTQRWLSREVELSFDSPTTGTFVESSDTVSLVYASIFHVPFDYLNLGFSVNIRKELYFHEIAITNVRYNKSEKYSNKVYYDSTGLLLDQYVIKDDRTNFGFGLRYEFGKRYLSNPGFSFDLSLAITQTFNWIRIDPERSLIRPTRGTFYNLEVAVIPQFKIGLSQRAKLGIKIIPNVLVVSASKIDIENLDSFWQGSKVSFVPDNPFDGPELNLTGSIGISYTVSEPEKRRRRGR